MKKLLLSIGLFVSFALQLNAGCDYATSSFVYIEDCAVGCVSVYYGTDPTPHKPTYGQYLAIIEDLKRQCASQPSPYISGGRI